jgi:hypothetical protein
VKRTAERVSGDLACKGQPLLDGVAMSSALGDEREMAAIHGPGSDLVKSSRAGGGRGRHGDRQLGGEDVDRVGRDGERDQPRDRGGQERERLLALLARVDVAGAALIRRLVDAGELFRPPRSGELVVRSRPGRSSRRCPFAHWGRGRLVRRAGRHRRAARGLERNLTTATADRIGTRPSGERWPCSRKASEASASACTT